MTKINIITPLPSNEFSRQIPHNITGFEFYENGDHNIKYDMVVVYEGVSEETRINCIEGNLLFISGEPPMSRRYSKGFLSQFSFVISSHTDLTHSNNFQIQQCLPWHFGFNFKTRGYKYNFDDLENFEIPIKTRKMSIISSSKIMMPGHNKRAKFVKELKKRFPDSIDFFGKDTNPINDKADAIVPYFMTICIENSAINDYWTEKLADAYLGYALPIYHGCQNIKDYFQESALSVIDINDTTKAVQQIKFLLDNCESIYNERLQSIKEARNLLLNKYNIYPSLIDFYTKNQLYRNEKPMQVNLLPNHSFGDYKRILYKLKVERLIKKLYYKFK